MFFYGTHETANLKSDEMWPYNPETRAKFATMKNMKKVGYQEGLLEIEEKHQIAAVEGMEEVNNVAPLGRIEEVMMKEPSTSGATGSASPSAPTTASVPPTLKRPREMMADSDSQSSSEGAMGGSASVPGMQKKARTISSTEGLNLQVSSGGIMGGEEEQGISGSGEVESDSSMQVMEPGEERREVGSSSQFFGAEVVGTSGEVAACSGVTTSTQEEEEVLDSEQEEGEDEVEVSEDIEDGEVPDDMEPENLEDDEESEVDPGQDADIEIDEAAVGTSEDEGEVVAGEDEQIGNVANVEDNSSEPSSSTGARHRTAGQAFASATQGLSGYEVETGGDSVVPSTPNLPLARRTDGFAEAVSSPQVKLNHSAGKD